MNTFGVPADSLSQLETSPMSRHQGKYYVRFTVVDRPGVFADIATALRDHDVSMEAIIQRGRSPGGAVEVVLTTHEAQEEAMVATIDAISKSDAVVETTRMIRIVSFS